MFLHSCNWVAQVAYVYISHMVSCIRCNSCNLCNSTHAHRNALSCNEFQMIIVTEKPSCKANCKLPHFFIVWAHLNSNIFYSSQSFCNDNQIVIIAFFNIYKKEKEINRNEDKEWREINRTLVNSCVITSFPLVVTMNNTIVAFFLTYKKKKEKKLIFLKNNKVEQNGTINKNEKNAS